MYQPQWEAMPREELRALQVRRLGELFERLEASPFYRGRIHITEAMRRDPLAALADLPLTSKADLREHYPWGFVAVPPESITRIHASSGTKGKPTVVAYTARDLDSWSDLCARALVAAGARPGHRIHNAYGYGLFTGGLGLHQGIERLGATVIPASGGATRRQVTLLVDLAPQGLCCTPSFALMLAETMDEMGVERSRLALRYGIFGAEPWTDAMRRRIEARLNLSAVDIYGLSEVLGPGVAVECHEAKDGLHLFEDHFVAEVVDPRTGELLGPGEQGELVLTTLTKEAMPLLRYRTGDLVRLDDAPCVCGRTHRRMSRVLGRVDDMLIVRGVNVFPSEVERILLEFPLLAPNYQLVWEAGAMDRLRVEVESQTPLDDPRDLAVRVGERIRAELGVTLEVSVLAPRALPRPEGKAVRVVDRRAAVAGTP